MRLKIIAAAAIAGGLVLGGPGVALADHTHSMQTGGGSCVLLAQNGQEKYVQLPFAAGAANRRHPLHVLVHLGEPGKHKSIGVAGSSSDPCLDTEDYVND